MADSTRKSMLRIGIQGRLVLEKDSSVELPIVGYNVVYAVNEIPSAEVVVAVGRVAGHVGSYSAIHDILDKLLFMEKAKLYSTFTGDMTPEKKWAGNEALIFDGYYTGYSYRKSSGSIQLVMQLAHWSIALTFASMLSRSIHPGTPTELSFPSLVRVEGNTKGPGSGGAAFTSGSLACSIFAVSSPSATPIASDTWKALKTFLLALANGTKLNPGLLANNLGTASDTGKNDEAIEALERVDYFGGDVLSIKHIISGGSLPSALAKSVSQDTIDSYATQTAWDKMIKDYSPEFMLSFIPQPDRMLVRPLTLLYNKEWRTVLAETQGGIQGSLMVRRPLKGVELVGAMNGSDAGATPKGETAVRALQQSYYPTDCEQCKRGTIYFEMVPRWMKYLPYSPDNEPTVKKSMSMKNSAHGEGPTASSGSGESSDNGYTDRLLSFTDIAKGYAHHAYVRESVRSRTQQVNSKLRFDIAPGSTIKIEGSKEWLAGSDAAAVTFFGTVSRVTISVDAENRSAGVAYDVGWLRTEAENEDPSGRLVITDHPLYSKPWSGDVLIPDLANDD